MRYRVFNVYVCAQVWGWEGGLMHCHNSPHCHICNEANEQKQFKYLWDIPGQVSISNK